MLEQLERRKIEAQMRAENRLPPGQAATIKFPVLHYGPEVHYPDLSQWSLRVFGQVEQEQTWSWEAFNQLPRRRVVIDIHCVTRWSKFDTLWEGVALQDLIEGGLITPLPSVRHVVQHCEYGYTTNTTLDFVLQAGFLLATHYDGAPLTPEHGYPLRGVAGVIAGERADDKYFWKGGKWLRALEFRAEDQLGFWERNGYHNNADVWREERFARGW